MSKKIKSKEQVLCENCISVTYDESVNGTDIPVTRCKRTGKQVEQVDTCKHAKSAFDNTDTGVIKSKRIKTEKNM